MSTESKPSEQQTLAESLGGFWSSFKQGKVIGYKWLALIILVVATIGITWYISSERSSATSQRWVAEEDASTLEAQEEIVKKYPGTIQAKLAQLQIARHLLGNSGIELLGASRTEVRHEGVANIEKARDQYQKLLDEFKDDPVLKTECLLGLAKAESALVAVPATPGQLTEFKGKVSKVVEYLDKLSEAAAPDTPWAVDSKKLADALRDEKSASYAEFVRIQRALFDFKAPDLPKLDGPLGPLGPITPGGTLPGVPGHQ